MAGGSVADPDAVPQWRLDVRVRTMRKKMFVAGPREARELDETAAFIWRLMDGTMSLQQIAECVAAEYDVAPAEVLADVRELATELLGCEAIELSPAAT